MKTERSELETQRALEKQKLQIEQRTRELKLKTELAKIESEDRIYCEAMGSDVVNPPNDYKKKLQSQVNLPTRTATKQSFANVETEDGLDLRDVPSSNPVKDEDQASSYVAKM